ncbi:nuclear transport factor 2 family protein [Phyllobacterium salinisoli]|uniref:Nuclear transport factor 2 family protein n=1 Tax=Phyllobacterium salinisoli TaxID=1899321 RepID=A0A368K2H2_9HYPH|nr:nuclear transport factor 2 family protein [Phyllobacterium salinisoli]RCS22835.1 nuclear transport factor 2 family protein [Phyllobacterium salinisoli]
MTDRVQAEEDVIRELERRRLRALVAADMAAAAPLHADDFQLITPIGMPLSREQYLGAIAAGQIKYTMWEPGVIAVRLHGSAAVIRYRARLEVIFQGHPVPPGEYWHTDIYERRDGRWMVVWSQATAIDQQ